MIVNKQKSIEFINDCNCLVDYIELEKAMLWYQNKPTSKLKHIYLYGNYPAVTIFNKKIHIHRLLMMYWNNIKELPKNVYIHHKNENKLDSSKSNLIFMQSSKHQSKHNKGKTISKEQKESIINSNHKRKGIKKEIVKKDVSYKRIWELHQKGYSINKISKELRYDWQQVKTRINEIYDNPELIEKEGK